MTETNIAKIYPEATNLTPTEAKSYLLQLLKKYQEEYKTDNIIVTPNIRAYFHHEYYGHTDMNIAGIRWEGNQIYAAGRGMDVTGYNEERKLEELDVNIVALYQNVYNNISNMVQDKELTKLANEQWEFIKRLASASHVVKSFDNFITGFKQGYRYALSKK